MIDTHFKNLAAFLHMGGYARFVWPAYLLTLGSLLLNALVYRGRLSAQRATLRKKHAPKTSA